MQFLLYEIGARLVAIYLCFDCIRELQYAFAERKITYLRPDLMDWLLGWQSRIADRDANPVLYWLTVSVRTMTLLASIVVAIFGWWQPNT